jgi:hypothetical protein
MQADRFSEEAGRTHTTVMVFLFERKRPNLTVSYTVWERPPARLETFTYTAAETDCARHRGDPKGGTAR